MLRRLIHTSRKINDVVVIGGGPAGLAVLTALQSIPSLRHLKATVVEAQPLAERLSTWAEKKRPQAEEAASAGAAAATEFENRVISVTPRSVNFLERIGCWPHVLHERVLPYDEMCVWDGESGAAIDFDGWDGNGRTDGVIASMIEISNLQQALYVTGSTRDNVVESKVSEIARSENGWPLVRLANGTEIETRLLIGADGQQSPVRAFAGIESRGWDYGRAGVVGTLHLEYDNFRTAAYQRFLRSGPLAILPLPGDRATMVWSTLPERAAWLKQLDGRTLAAVVNAGLRLDMVDIDYIHSLDPRDGAAIRDEISWRLDQHGSPEGSPEADQEEQNLPTMIENVVESTVASFPLRMRHADAYTADRVALVGDAAHATHPLTGQGLNMGLRDIQALVAALESAVERGLDVGSALALEPYPREAYLQNHLLLGVNDKFHKLYSTDFWPVVALRSLGLTAVNSLPWIKNLAMAQAGK